MNLLLHWVISKLLSAAPSHIARPCGGLRGQGLCSGKDNNNSNRTPLLSPLPRVSLNNSGFPQPEEKEEKNSGWPEAAAVNWSCVTKQINLSFQHLLRQVRAINVQIMARPPPSTTLQLLLVQNIIKRCRRRRSDPDVMTQEAGRGRFFTCVFSKGLLLVFLLTQEEDFPFTLNYLHLWTIKRTGQEW